jgi:hypothetical protein
MADTATETRELIEALRRFTEVMERQLAQQRSWKLALRNGLLAGLGGVIGATVVVSILISIMQPFRGLEAVGPMIDRLDLTLRQSNRR